MFSPGRGSNQDLLRANPTLYRVAVKADLNRKAIQVYIIPSATSRLVCVGPGRNPEGRFSRVTAQLVVRMRFASDGLRNGTPLLGI